MKVIIKYLTSFGRKGVVVGVCEALDGDCGESRNVHQVVQLFITILAY